MKKSYLTFAPLGLCILTALAPACRLGDDNPEDALKAQGAANASDATFTVIDMSDGVCENPRCFKVTSSKDLSFIAVDAACPSATGIQLDLYHYVNGSPQKVNASPAPQGEGSPCGEDGIVVPADAQKFEGLMGAEYLVCVTFEGVKDGGSVTIYAKAGTSCTDEEFDDCVCAGTEPDDTSGTGGAGGAGDTGGAGGAGTTGGAGGAGGAGGDDEGCGGWEGTGGWWGTGGAGGWWGTGGAGGWWGTGGGCDGCDDCGN
jgi:hypothetical protein